MTGGPRASILTHSLIEFKAKIVRTHNVAGRTLLDESELDNLYKAGFLIVAGARPYEWL